MHTVKDILAILKMRKSLGIPMDGGSCFGVRDASELRPVSPQELPQEGSAPCSRCGGTREVEKEIPDLVNGIATMGVPIPLGKLMHKIPCPACAPFEDW